MPYNHKNNLASFCLIGLALSALFAARAESSAPAGLEPGAVRTTSVVRADAKTGRLVRRVVMVQPESAAKGAPGATAADSGRPTAVETLRSAVDREVESAAGKYGVDPKLVHTVIRVESNYNPIAVSNKGAQGLMQLIPATARRMGAENSFDVRENIEAGVRYLRYLLDRFGDDRLALAAYNAGEGAVQRFGDVPPYIETQQYVQRAGKLLKAARQQEPASAAAPAPGAVAAPAGPPEPRPIETYVDVEGRICIRTR
jgi:soluble lytic murein transglycosylase-like protein